MSRVSALLALCGATAFGLAALADGPSDVELGALYLKTEIAGRIVAEADKLAGTNAVVREEVSAAAREHQARMVGEVRRRLLGLFPDEATARKEFAAFVDRFAKSADAETRGAIIQRELAAEIESAGKFLGDVQSWLRLREKGDVPPLAAWLARERTATAEKPKRRRKANPLRDAEAAAGSFVEASDDGESSLRSFGARRKALRERKLAEAQQGMEQVAAERRVADEEAAAKKLSAAQKEAAAQQAQAGRLAAAEQAAIVQDQNSWKTRLKGVLSTAVGATVGAFTSGVGAPLGQAAADAVLGNRRH